MNKSQSKIAILIETSNDKGNTVGLVNTIAQSINTDTYNLKDYKISPFNYEHKNIDDDFIGLVTDLLKYDQMIFASPVYWYTMSVQMKVFF